MAKTMGKGTGLSLRQKQFLAVVLEEPFILKNFYLSGGTALSCWYLHHRESYDLDLFTQGKFDSDQITNWLKAHQDKIGFHWMGEDEGWQFQTYFFRFPDSSRLKVDFGHYTDSRLQKGTAWKGLQIDSLYDIAVNKAHLFTISNLLKMLAPFDRKEMENYFLDLAKSLKGQIFKR